MSLEQELAEAGLDRIAGAFRAGVKVYTSEKSPLYAALAKAGADDPDILEIASHGMASAPPVHLFTSVHFLLLGGLADPLASYFPTLTESPLPPDEAWPDFRRFCLEHRDELIELLRTRPVQMTYVERCRNILAPMSYIADQAGEPLNLIEIGCSVGVLLTFDRYAYELHEGERVGPEDAPFLLKGKLAGGPKLRIPRIGTRTGLDLNIIDTNSEEDRRWMLATCFPELLEKQAQLAEAMDIVAETDIRWMEGDALVNLRQALADTPDPVCVFHNACLFYWPQEAKAALDELLCEESRKRTIYRFGVEPSDRHNEVMSGTAGDREKTDTEITGELTYTCYSDGKLDRKILALSSVTLGETKWLG
ncbi:MAG: DUF2332 domain-containing protein [Novosphingobium sp.]